MANLGVVSALVGRRDLVFEDRLNHASLLDAGLLSGARMIRYPHVDAVGLRQRLKSVSGSTRACPARTVLIATDGVFSMDGDIASIRELAQIASQHDAWLMVDDAHGLGVLGDNGGGTLEHLDVDHRGVPILMGTLGKALGTCGAFVAGQQDLIETLIQAARTYIYTTAPPAAVAVATRAALRVCQEETWRREKLRELVKRFRSGAHQLGLPLTSSDTPIQPLLIGDAAKAKAASDALFEQGLHVTAIRPPTVPSDTARLRITLSATHGENHVDRLLQGLDAVLTR
jgi:8-amino-7-oxononanoate synthase